MFLEQSAEQLRESVRRNSASLEVHGTGSSSRLGWGLVGHAAGSEKDFGSKLDGKAMEFFRRF